MAKVGCKGNHHSAKETMRANPTNLGRRIRESVAADVLKYAVPAMERLHKWREDSTRDLFD